MARLFERQLRRLRVLLGDRRDYAVAFGKGALQVPPLRYPGFPVELGGVGNLHVAFLEESRTRGRCGTPRSRKSGYAPVGMTKGGLALP
jgi:hypothetical protein